MAHNSACGIGRVFEQPRPLRMQRGGAFARRLLKAIEIDDFNDSTPIGNDIGGVQTWAISETLVRRTPRQAASASCVSASLSPHSSSARSSRVALRGGAQCTGRHLLRLGV